MEPRDNGMLAYSLRTHDEVRDPKEAFDDIPDTKADPKMVEIAAQDHRTAGRRRSSPASSTTAMRTPCAT